MIQRMLNERGVSPILTTDAEEMRVKQKEYKEILLREEYGQPLPPPDSLSFEVIPPKKIDCRFAAGEATYYTVMAHGTLLGKEFSFPFHAILPNRPGKYPFFVHNDFDAGAPTKGCPAEEIINRGFAILHVCYQDVTSDDGDFTSGLAGVMYEKADGECRAPDAPGKIVMWAWANMRLMDFAQTLDCLDRDAGAVIGHSRLGKTALVTGLLDERFRYVIANNSGCSGDALSRGNQGEQIADITKRFPYWFCRNYQAYAERGYGDFDQHQLVAALAPRCVMVGTAEDDGWADPHSQYLSCCAATPAWTAFGEQGLIAPDRLPVVGDCFGAGKLAFHLRAGAHYLSRLDWNRYMDRMEADRKQ